MTYKQTDRHSDIRTDRLLDNLKMVPSQTLDRQKLDTINPRQANTRHDKPQTLISIRDNKA